MRAYINRLFAESPSELRNVCHGHVVQIPKHILIKYTAALANTNLDAICQQIVLSDEIFFLNPIVQGRILTLQY